MKTFTIIILIATDAILFGLGWHFGSNKAKADFIKAEIAQELGNPFSWCMANHNLDYTDANCEYCWDMVYPRREYQFNVDTTGYTIFQGDDTIGFVPYGQSPVLDSLIDYDNL